MAPRSGRPGLPPRRRKRRSREFGRATTPVLPKRSPSPGRWIRPGRCPPSGATATAQFVDWPADPHQTPSGGGHRADPGQKRDPARRLRKKGIDQSTPVTEGWAKHVLGPAEGRDPGGRRPCPRENILVDIDRVGTPLRSFAHPRLTSREYCGTARDRAGRCLRGRSPGGR
jgi:hypothetical protein